MGHARQAKDDTRALHDLAGEIDSRDPPPAPERTGAVLCGYRANMLLFASSNHAARTGERSQGGRHSGRSRERDGRFPVSIMVADDCDAEVLGIAKALDPDI